MLLAKVMVGRNGEVGEKKPVEERRTMPSGGSWMWMERYGLAARTVPSPRGASLVKICGAANASLLRVLRFCPPSSHSLPHSSSDHKH